MQERRNSLHHNQLDLNSIAFQMRLHRRLSQFIQEHLNHLKSLALSQVFLTFLLRLRILQDTILPKRPVKGLILLLQTILFICLMVIPKSMDLQILTTFLQPDLPQNLILCKVWRLVPMELYQASLH